MSAQELINSYIVEDELSEQAGLAAQLAAKYSLLAIVTQLEDSLTQEDAHVRAKATQCLADVVRSLPQLKPQEVLVLTVFLSDRLSDDLSIESAAQGLDNLACKYKLPASAGLLDKLKELDMLNMEIETRYKVLLLLQTLSKHATSEFVSCFVALAGGEKDPRNLMVNLKTTYSVLKQIGDDLSEDQRALMYDITFCYFPLKFHPPRNMPYTITAAEIKEQLATTLASPQLAQWVIPGLISKLTAINLGVKLDSLDCLDRTLSNLTDLEPYWFTVYDGLKFEVLHGTSQSETFSPVIKIFTKFVDVPMFIDAVLKELETEGLPQNKLTQICHLVVGISTKQQIWDLLVSKAIERCWDQPTVLLLFLKSTEFTVPFPDQVLQSFLRALANGDTREGIEGLKLLAQNPAGDDYVPLVIQTLSEEQAYPELAELAPVRSNAVRDHALPLLLSKLPSTLDALSKICCTRSLVHVLTVRLLSRLDLQDQALSLKYLQCLIISTSQLNVATDFVGFDRVLIPPLFEKLREATNLAPGIVESACILVEKAGRGVAKEQQIEFAATVTQNIGKFPFHIIISSLASMDEFPFEANFIETYAIPSLINSSDVLERAGFLRLVALVSNKWPQSVDLVKFNELLESKSSDPQMLEIWAWFTKGLINRADKLGFENAIKIAERAANDTVAATVFGVVVATDRLLSKENGCIIRTLFRQRLFTTLLPQLKAGSNREALIVLSNLLKYTPQKVIAPYFGTMLSMLTSSLNENSSALQETSLKSLLTSLPESGEIIQPHLATLVPRLLEISQSSSTGSARLSALELIMALKNALPEDMHDFADAIINGLIPVIGDKKRSVRKEAVKCRQAFY